MSRNKITLIGGGQIGGNLALLCAQKELGDVVIYRVDVAWKNKMTKSDAMEGIVLNRLTEPSDIAPIVSFITSGKLDHATGSTIDINGGSYLR